MAEEPRVLEEELQARGVELGDFFDDAGVAMALIDVEAQKILAINKAALDLVERPANEVLGRPGRDFLVEPSEDRVLRARLLRGERTRVVRELKTSSSPRVVELHGVPRDDGLVFIQMVDLTEVIQVNSDLEQHRTELEAKTAALASVAHRMAHDLRSPLVVIRGTIDLLKTRLDQLSDEVRTDLLDRSSTNIEALSRMINDVMEDATRSGGPRSQGSSEVVHLFETVRAAVLAQLDDARASLEVSSDIPTLPVPASTIRQPIVNLISNSIKYRHPDRPCRISLSVGVTEDDTEVVVDVVDNGVGIPDDAEHLFGAGSRGDDVAHVEGSGLGLSFSRSVVEELGGTLHAVPKEEGAHLQIRIPRRTAGADEEDLFLLGGTLGSGLSSGELDQMITAAPTPIVVIDLERRRVLRVNRAAEQFFGEPASELVGRRGRELLSDPDQGDDLRERGLTSGAAPTFLITTIVTATGPRPAQIGFHVLENTMIGVAHIHDLSAAYSQGSVSAPPADG